MSEKPCRKRFSTRAWSESYQLRTSLLKVVKSPKGTPPIGRRELKLAAVPVGLKTTEFGRGPTVVLLHALGSGRMAWMPTAKKLLATHRQFSEAVSEVLGAGDSHLVIDLTDTTFMDSTSLGTLISARRRTHAMGGSFVNPW